MESDSEAALEDTLDILQDARVSNFLAKHHYQLFLQKNDQQSLDEAILCARRTVELSSSMNPLLRRYCFRAANYLTLRHRRPNQPGDTDIKDALRYLDKGASTLIDSETPREKAQRLAVRADCLSRLYESGRDGEYGKAHHAFHEILEAWKEVGDANKMTQCLRNIAALYAAKFVRGENKDLAFLDLSVEYVEKAIASCDSNSEILSQLLREKLEYLHYRAALDGSKAEQDYQAIINTTKLLINDCSSSDIAAGRKTDYQAWLGLSYLKLACQATPRDHPDWKMRFDKYQEAWVAIGFLPPGVDYALQAQEQLVAQIKASDKDEVQGQNLAQPSQRLTTLKQLCYGDRWIAKDPSRLPSRPENLGVNTSEEDTQSRIKRFEQEAKQWRDHWEQQEDSRESLRKAIKAAEKAVAAAEGDSSINHRRKAGLYNALGHYIMELFEAIDDDMEESGLVERAMEVGYLALTLVEDDDDCGEERDEYAGDVDDWREREKAFDQGIKLGYKR